MRPRAPKNRTALYALAATAALSAFVLWVSLSRMGGSSRESWVPSWIPAKADDADIAPLDKLPAPSGEDRASTLYQSAPGGQEAAPSAGPAGADALPEPRGPTASSESPAPAGSKGALSAFSSFSAGNPDPGAPGGAREEAPRSAKPGASSAEPAPPGKAEGPDVRPKDARLAAAGKKTAGPSALGLSGRSQEEKAVQELLAEFAKLPASLRAGKVSLDADYARETPKDFEIPAAPPTTKESADAMEKAEKLGGKQALMTGVKLLAAAYRFIGIPYKLGGDGVRTTDCSMFTRMAAVTSGLEPKAFRRGAGIQYGYSAKRQFEMQMISRSNSYYGTDLSRLMPGDFLFFNWRNEFCRVRPYGVGHVGLYIGPTKGKRIYILHAGNPVKRAWIDTKYLVGIGRIVK
ncbi:MAG TPA: hypothetical protein DCM05_09635 [Elusimicrobia bacterium]|nr:hypothetical protein [Elusimicrobiota bacterium]